MIKKNVPDADVDIGHDHGDWVTGDSETGKLVRALDWQQTALGPLPGWPQSLRVIVNTALCSRFPIMVWWGPELVMIYNDALSTIFGNKHPSALGRRGADGWSDVWHLLGPMLKSVLDEGASTWSENHRMNVNRTLDGGFIEEAYFSFACSPIHDESGQVGGVFCAITETSAQVFSDRRLRTLAALVQQMAEVTTANEACLRSAVALAANAADVPWALLYLADGPEGDIRLAGTAGVNFPIAGADGPAGFEWPLVSVLKTGSPFLVDENCVQQALVPTGGPFLSLSKGALLLPLGAIGKACASGALVVGLAPSLLLDKPYQNFLELAAGHIGMAVSYAQALEAARLQVEALTQLDRAKTAFFANISHEFRTPLTLMLGPTEDALASELKVLGGADLERVHRNEKHLLRLVNTLLDFSRVEAGRADAAFESVDLSALTTDLASEFRSAIERAGLTFNVNCEPLGEPAYIDRDMWEKIVFNLLSNALKFTFKGAINVVLRECSGMATLVVSDSGVGIAAEELPRVFERFHRVKESQSRTREGSGIGLALVQSLVGLHGGSINLESVAGKGSAFTVSIPTGNAHLLADRLCGPRFTPAHGTQDNSLVTEAMRWLQAPGSAELTQQAHQQADIGGNSGDLVSGPRILVVDDNADLRDYVARLLRKHWLVDTAADGVEALAKAQSAVPLLVLTDVWMPNLDGFGLLRALRSDAKTRMVPVLVLSARATEESRIEGLLAGADDYLIKPFSAKELVARVATHIELGKLRSAAESERSQLYSLFKQAPAAIALLRGPNLVYEFSNPLYEQLVRRRSLIGKPLVEVFPEFKEQAIHGILKRVYATGERFVGRELLVRMTRIPGTEPEDIYFDLVYEPLRGADAAVDGIMVLALEVTERVLSSQQRERWHAERESLYSEREQLLDREREARADAERALQAKDEFLAMLGHELRNPLAPIVMTLEILRHRGVEGAAREHALIERQVTHVTRLIDDLLDVSAITRGKIELKRELIELAALVDGALEIAAPLIEQRGHELIMDVPRQGFILDADTTRMTQVISNLLNNAAKYTERGGRIVVSAKTVDGEVVLQVSDNGVGISQAMLPHVFELFVQERQAIDRARGGLGLGLAIVRNLLTMHGGRVTVMSGGQGSGSTFTVFMPLAPENVVGLTGKSPDKLLKLTPVEGSCRVLVVDDNVDAAMTLALVLNAFGCETRVAHDGRSALALLDSFQPELALLDIGLPVMDGYELARRIRERMKTSRIRLVAVTGYGQKSDVEHAFAAGFDEHLVKPVKIERLKAVLERVHANDQPQA